ncbi:MAG TPA: DUF2244 domain-containing protein [Steroidobacteraceae bacterium]|nr:DUF2244 domain-containing protein [Steroidobacteraceae bacterium]
MEPQALTIIIAPTCALSVRGALLFFGGVCTLSFSIAGALALLGYWPILPFAGMEMVLLGWALRASLGRRHCRQTITVSERQVQVLSRDTGREVCIEFPRHWAQVKLRRPVSRLHPSRLLIESHGRTCEVGGFLTEAERRGLAERLSRLIGRINESPVLDLGGCVSLKATR